MGTPQLNIKDAEATRLARELADLTGESQTEVVRTALRQRLERETAERHERTVRTKAERRQEFERTLAKIRKIQNQVQRRRSGDSDFTEDDLYDASGLPK